MPEKNHADQSVSAGAGLPVGQAVELAGLVAYSRSAIVSRTIVDSSAATMTVFAFDAGQRLSEHTAPFEAVAQIVAGSAKISVGGRQVSASAGQLVLMPADVPHAVEAPERFKMLLTMIKPLGQETP